MVDAMNREWRPQTAPESFNSLKGNSMNTKLATTALLIGALLVPVAGYSADDKDADRSSPKAFVKDSIITAKIKAEMMKDPGVSAMSVKVDTDDKGVVHLTGTAKSRTEADKAEQIAKGISGVTTVQNNIKVAGH
ncbi:MAG: BON domain-containing protein [Betaproteobacteria bacterium]